MKNLLTIAGSDCSGGAGVQADLKTFSAHGVFGMSVIVSVVAENTRRVISVQDVDPQIVGDQIDAVFEDIRVDGVKVGMLSSAEIMRITAAKLSEYRAPRPVIDPVMTAKGGSALMRSDALETLIQKIIPMAFLLTPNIPEAEAISGRTISCIREMEEAARIIHDMGAENVLIKGGHLAGDAEDILFDGKEICRFRAKRIRTVNTHGTGCTYSSAIAANLARGMEIGDAIGAAKEYITSAIEHSLPIGKGHGPVNHFYMLNPGFNAEHGGIERSVSDEI
jgi:hydroxymethylpyrimidine/phosphomethylpyrimidine kinase